MPLPEGYSAFDGEGEVVAFWVYKWAGKVAIMTEAGVQVMSVTCMLSFADPSD